MDTGSFKKKEIRWSTGILEWWSDGKDGWKERRRNGDWEKR
jgi:hypothetical protein